MTQLFHRLRDAVEKGFVTSSGIYGTTRPHKILELWRVNRRESPF